MAGINISFLSNVRDFLKGTKDVESSLDDVAGSLDDLAGDAKRASSKIGDGLQDVGKDGKTAADKLEASFKQALDGTKTSAKGAGDSIGDDVKRGTDKAGEGVDEFGREANSTAKESAASFDGSADSIAGAFQEVAANAFAGFGPAGALAGLAVAGGMGIAVKSLTDSAERAAELKARVLELAGELSDVGGDVSKIDLAGKMREWGLEVKDAKSWFEFWQKDTLSNFEVTEAAASKFGVSVADVFRGMSGSDSAAAGRAWKELTKQIDADDAALATVTRTANGWLDSNGRSVDSVMKHRDAVADFRGELEQSSGITEESIAIQSRLDAAIGTSAAATERLASLQEGLSSAITSLDDPVSSYEAILTRKSDADRAAAEATAAGTKSAEDSWEDYATNVSVSIGDMIADMEAKAAAVSTWSTNILTLTGQVPQGMIDEFIAAGPEVSGAAVAMLAAAAPSDLATYAAAWSTAANAGGDALIKTSDRKAREAAAAAQHALDVTALTLTPYVDLGPAKAAIAAWTPKIGAELNIRRGAYLP